MQVLIADNVSRQCDAVLNAHGIETVRAVGTPRQELLAMLPNYEGMIVRSAVTVDREMIQAMPRMLAIGRAGAGVDNIDVVAATERGILVMNTPGGNTTSAAEHTLAMLMSLLRKIPAANASIRQGKWDRKTFVGTELFGKRVGVLGLGRIGREVASRIASFQAQIVGYDPVLSPEAVRALGLEPTTFQEMVESCQIITIHIPLTAATRGLIGRPELARMPHGSFIINCARGGIVDEAALLEALNSGQIAGAALDVFSTEPPTFPAALMDHPNVVATPHIAASTHEAQERVAVDIAVQMAEFFEGLGARGVVNANGMEDCLMSAARPMMRATRLLGRLLAQLGGPNTSHFNLIAHGPDATQIMQGLEAALLTGVMCQRQSGAVNEINAARIAAAAGITVEAVGEGEHPRYQMLIAAEVVAASDHDGNQDGDEDDGHEGGQSHHAAVTLFGRDDVRLVMLDNLWLDVVLSGVLLLIRGTDRPGALAAMGGALAQQNINISDVSLGRCQDSGDAVTVIRIDGDVSPEALDALRNLPVVQTVKVVRMG